MPELMVGLSALKLPDLVLVEQRFPTPQVDDVGAAVRDALAAPEIAARLRPGLTAAVAVGSRGIAGLDTIVAALVAALRERGVEPFIVPAMGSHGGATAQGQRELLARYRITEETAGAPIRSGMEAEVVGHLRHDPGTGGYQPGGPGDDALPVYMDRHALREADLVIPVARVKPHTGFRGRYESGICKMLCIGLGKHVGCSRLHREGYGRFPALIPAAAATVLATGRIGFALAVVENAAERTARIEAVPAERVLAREPALLELARTLMPRLLLPAIDVLVVEEFGKDISGVGMDPGITGRSESGTLPGFDGPAIQRIVVLGLTPATHGNATGIGLADIITERVFGAIDRTATYTNVLTSGSLVGGKIPLAVPGDEAAILAAASCVPGVKVEDVGIVRIRSTLRLERIAVSRNLLPVVERTAGCAVLGPFTGRWDAAASR